MAFGTTLANLRTKLRAEVGQSLNTLQGANAQGQYDMALDRTQKELWESYEWPHLRYYSNLAAMAGQQLYAYPPDMPFDYIIKGYVLSGTNNWAVLDFGIGLQDYSTYGEAGQSWPILKWGNRPTVTAGVTDPIGKLELWPIPNQNGSIRFLGQAPVNPLVADGDKAVLDDTLITLFAAAEILASQKAENSALKLQKANQFLRRHFANLGGGKRRTIALGGYGSMPGQGVPLTPGIDYIPPGYNG